MPASAHQVGAAETGSPRSQDVNGASQDVNGASQAGVGLYEVTQKDGERCSVARADLHPVLARAKLTVLTGAHPSRVMLDGTGAVGLVSAAATARPSSPRAGKSSFPPAPSTRRSC